MKGDDNILIKDALLKELEGLTDEEIKVVLAEKYGLDWVFYNRTCKAWYAKVFTYCRNEELQEQLDFFFFLVNLYAHLFGFCFNEEDTVFLGCTCPCGKKQAILYYTISHQN